MPLILLPHKKNTESKKDTVKDGIITVAKP